MALQSLTGGWTSQIGPTPLFTTTGNTTITLDAAAEAAIYIGYLTWSDGGSHTIDTTGSSALGWRSAAATFANGSTIVKVGLAPVDTGAGPAARASNTTNVINFDVSKSHTGGGGGITANAWQTNVPDTGTKTIANGDLIAFAVQMTARGGADAIRPTHRVAPYNTHRPTVTSHTGGAYATEIGSPNCIVVASDGTVGYFHASEVFSSFTTRTWNSGDATKEYGQLYNLPFPCKIYGIYGWLDPDADCDIVLYSDPLGTPVAEKTISIDANVVTSANLSAFFCLFPAAYSLNASTNIAAVFKPGGSNVSTIFKTIGSATYRITDSWGTTGYGISRASGAFANANTSLDHYYIGLLGGGFDDGAGAAGGMLRHPGMMGGLNG